MSVLSGMPNILLIIADDLGEDVVEISTGPPRILEVVTNDGTEIRGSLTNLSLFLRNGQYFEQAWAQPACSPTRASIYTGVHPWKSGVGSPMNNPELDSGNPDLIALPNLLPSEYVAGLFGKWHLGSIAGTLPTDHGWDKHVGTLRGVITRADRTGSYSDWDMVDSDNSYTLEPTTSYATYVTVREAAEWIEAQDPDTPWFTTIAFHTPHDPFHDPPGGFDPATAGNPNSRDRKFNLMTQNMDFNIGRLITTGGPSPYGFNPIAQDQLENTIIIFIGDNGSHKSIAIEEEKTQVYEGGVRVPMIIADGQAVVQEINSQLVTPRFLEASKLNKTTTRLAHVVDLYKTILRLADPAVIGFPGDTDSKDLGRFFKNPGPQPPVRLYNFSQWYTGGDMRATIRNRNYKLNYDAAASPNYSLYLYDGVEIPGREDDSSATNIYDDATNSSNLDALINLNELLDELINHYQGNEDDLFPEPRPF